MIRGTMKSMDKDRSSPSEQSQQAQVDETSSRPSTDATVESRPESDSGPDTLSEQCNPAAPGLEFGGYQPPGAFVTSIEVVQALRELTALSDERVLGAIRAFRTEILTRLDAMDATSKARLDAHDIKSEARMNTHEVKSDARMVVHEAKSQARMDIHEAMTRARHR